MTSRDRVMAAFDHEDTGGGAAAEDTADTAPEPPSRPQDTGDTAADSTADEQDDLKAIRGGRRQNRAETQYAGHSELQGTGRTGRQRL